MKSFFILFTGCTRRQIDCERIKNYFIANGLSLASLPNQADYVLVSTCGLSEYLEYCSICNIQTAKRYKGETIVFGCLPVMNGGKLKTVFNGRIVNTKEIDKIDRFFPEFLIKFSDVPDANKAFSTPTKRRKDRIANHFRGFGFIYPYLIYNISRELWNRMVFDKSGNSSSNNGNLIKFGNARLNVDFDNNLFTIRISSGCIGKCSYCNIRKAIGPLKSKSTTVLISEIEKAIANNQFKLNVIASDTGSYGLDIGTTFPELLSAILSKDDRLIIQFIQDLHPKWITLYKQELLQILRAKRLRSILTAVQSGSVRILKLMNRYFDPKGFKVTIKSMKSAFPNLRLRTQVIVGFPTETDKDLLETITLITDCRFDEVDIFRYHETPTTDSGKYYPKIPHDVIDRRVVKLYDELPLCMLKCIHQKKPADLESRRSLPVI